MTSSSKPPLILRLRTIPTLTVPKRLSEPRKKGTKSTGSDSRHRHLRKLGRKTNSSAGATVVCPRPSDQLVVFSRPSVSNLFPVQGRASSLYVRAQNEQPVILANACFPCPETVATAKQEHECPHCLYMVTSAPFNIRDRYFGMLYPDETALSYIPIADTVIEKPLGGSSHIFVRISTHAYDSICSSVRKNVEDAKARLPVTSEGERGETRLEWKSPHKNLVWTLSAGKYYSKTVNEVLGYRKKVEGVGCFVVKYRRHDLCAVGELFFEFHSMIVQADVDAVFGPIEEMPIEI